MNNLNSIIIEGNVVRQPELTEPANGFKVCTIQVAVNRWYKNHQGEGVTEVSYFDIETYNKMAEFVHKQSRKGRGIRVVGRLKQDRWTGQDGKNTSKVYIVAEHIEYKPVISEKKETIASSAEMDAEETSVEEKETQETALEISIPSEKETEKSPVPETVVF